MRDIDKLKGILLDMLALCAPEYCHSFCHCSRCTQYKELHKKIAELEVVTTTHNENPELIKEA